jgi:hypoxanthine phosphoribosyltransferase
MKIKTISYPELEIACRKIKSYVEKEKPDWIIPIYGGGKEIIDISGLSDEKWNIHAVFITHKGKESWERIKWILKKMPKTVLNLLRNIDFIRPRSNERITHFGNIQKVSGKVLIIDDTIDRGVTLDYLYRKLEEIGITKDNIRVAVVNDIRGKGPGFSIYKNILISFPWNLDY